MYPVAPGYYNPGYYQPTYPAAPGYYNPGYYNPAAPGYYNPGYYNPAAPGYYNPGYYNPAAPGNPAGVVTPPGGNGSGAAPPAPGTCELVYAINRLTEQVSLLNKAYREVNKEKIKARLDDSPDRKAVDEAITKLKAEEGIRSTAHQSRAEIDRKLALLKAGKLETSPSAARLVAR